MELNYITYQGIPSYNTYAYGICTFSTIKYLVRNDFDVKLVFPLREKSATTDISKLQDFYEMYEDFELKQSYNMKHISMMCLFGKLNETCIMKYGENRPMEARYSLDEDSYVAFYLAPKFDE